MEKIFTSWSYIEQYDYKSFLPNNINQDFIWKDKQINMLLEKANLELGKLESFSNFIPDIDFFISMHIGKEAIQSSKIEGTKTLFDDLFFDNEDVTLEQKDDKKEVQNYVDALNFWIKQLDELPLSMRLFSNVHEILLKSVRWSNKSPGEIRKSQNWIGGSNLKDAFFIPPHQDDLSNLLSDLEKFLHNDSLEIPELIKIALVHYQFETIHPYLDGNGRIGRLMIILYLIEKNIISRPVLYISDFFERNKWSYYDALTLVRSSNNIEHFIKFFLTGIVETCQSATYTFEEILKLKKIIDKQILTLGSRAENANLMLQYLFSKPIITSKNIVDFLKISPTTANSLIQSFIDIGILEEVTWFKRHKVYIFENYIKLFR